MNGPAGAARFSALSSAGLFDYVLNFSRATRPLWLLPVGALYFAPVLRTVPPRHCQARSEKPREGRDVPREAPRRQLPALAARAARGAWISALGGRRQPRVGRTACHHAPCGLLVAKSGGSPMRVRLKQTRQSAGLVRPVSQRAAGGGRHYGRIRSRERIRSALARVPRASRRPCRAAPGRGACQAGAGHGGGRRIVEALLGRASAGTRQRARGWRAASESGCAVSVSDAALIDRRCHFRGLGLRGTG